MMLIPIVMLIIWTKKTHAPIKPIIVGAITFALFVYVPEQIPIQLLIVADNEISCAINGSTWLYYLVGGLFAGIFEETGRFVA